MQPDRKAGGLFYKQDSGKDEGSDGKPQADYLNGAEAIGAESAHKKAHAAPEYAGQYDKQETEAFFPVFMFSSYLSQRTARKTAACQVALAGGSFRFSAGARNLFCPGCDIVHVPVGGLTHAGGGHGVKGLLLSVKLTLGLKL